MRGHSSSGYRSGVVGLRKFWLTPWLSPAAAIGFAVVVVVLADLLQRLLRW